MKSNKKIEAVTLCEETESPVSSIIRTTLLNSINNNAKLENAILNKAKKLKLAHS